jgi:hypothetical protein
MADDWITVLGQIALCDYATRAFGEIASCCIALCCVVAAEPGVSCADAPPHTCAPSRAPAHTCAMSAQLLDNAI